MTYWIDQSFDYRGFHCVWNHEHNHFMVLREDGKAPMGYATTRETAKKLIDKEVGD